MNYVSSYTALNLRKAEKRVLFILEIKFCPIFKRYYYEIINKIHNYIEFIIITSTDKNFTCVLRNRKK